MNAKEIESSIKKWCKRYSDNSITDNSENKEIFRDVLEYDEEDVHIIRMDDEDRTELAVASTLIIEPSPEYRLIQRIGQEQWREVVREFAAKHGPIDVVFIGDDENEGYNLLDYIYDDRFSRDLLHQRCRRLISIHRLIKSSLKSLHE